MTSMNISKAKIALANVFVIGSVTMASAQYMYAPHTYQGPTRYNVPQEQMHWYDRNAVGQNV